MRECPKERISDEGKSISSKHGMWESIHSQAGNFRQGEGLKEAAIVFVLEGSVEVSVDRFTGLIIQAGRIFLIPPSAVYQVKVLQDSHWMVCYFPMDTLLSIKSYVSEIFSIAETVDYNFDQLTINGILSGYLSLVNTYISDGVDSGYLFELKRQELFFLLLSSYPLEELASFFYPMIGEDIQFQEFVLTNHLKARNVKELAALANYSTSGFIKKFQRYFNESPYKWMSRQKANRIRLDITAGVMPLQEIAIKYKFSSYQHFADFCKAQFGVPPTAVSNTTGIYQK